MVIQLLLYTISSKSVYERTKDLLDFIRMVIGLDLKGTINQSSSYSNKRRACLRRRHLQYFHLGTLNLLTVAKNLVKIFLSIINVGNNVSLIVLILYGRVYLPFRESSIHELLLF